MPATLLGTKLHIPPLGPVLVPRPRLLAQLENGLEKNLTLVLAPPGFGKTTLISSWIRSWQDSQLQDRPRVAWLSLDRDDDELDRFLSYCISALQTVAPHLGEAARSILDFPQPVAAESLLTSLINDLTEWQKPLLLVLDDYHFVQSPEIHQAIAFWLDHSPPECHLLITSREEPPLPLARWRVRGQLVEIGFEELRFSHEEADKFLHDVMGLNLTSEAVDQLEDRTEGWVAGLQLAALSLRKSAQSQEGFAKKIEGSWGLHRYVVDYLAEEVMRQQPEHIRNFLHQTAVLDRLTASLCDAVTGRTDSKAVLSQLEHGNLFLISLDEHRQWYRFHHLFADFLRAALPQVEQRALHIKAGKWYEEHQFTTEAIQHALKAEDFEMAAALIASYHDEVLKQGGLTTLLGWLNALPEEVVLKNSVLTARKGHILYLRGQTEEARRYADAVAQTPLMEIPPAHRGEVRVFLADLAINEGRAAECLRLAQEALTFFSHAEAFSRTLALSLAGQSLRMLRDFDGAIHTLQQALEWGRRSGNHLVGLNALSHLVPLLFFQGRRAEAMILCQRALKEYKDVRGQPLPLSGLLHVPLGILHYEANELAEARRHLEIGVALCRQLGMLHLALTGQRFLAKLQFAEGETEAAFATLADARGFAERLGNARAERAILSVTADLHLRLGNVAAAAHLLDNSRGSAVWREHERLTRIRLSLAQGESQVAQHLLDEFMTGVEKDGRVARLITLNILKALAANALNDRETTCALMEKALRLAAPGNYQRLFLDEGQMVGALIRPLRQVAPNFLSSLVRAFCANVTGNTNSDAESAPSAITGGKLFPGGLSEREREVLRLVADGLSNDAIGNRLFISVGTVKWYLNGIYQKLAVRNRTEAVARARQEQLL
jgi:LuxR family maltose regulon positive regulatory protein